MTAAGHERPLARATALFVWGTFGALLALSFVIALRNARNVPWWDYWCLVPWLTGQHEVSATWLWSFHNEHRMPLTRLIHLGLSWLTHGDARAPVWFMLAAQAGLTAGLIEVARRIRGRLSLLDATIPLALLHLGLVEGFLQAFNVSMVLVSALFLVAAAAIAGSGPRLSVARGAVVWAAAFGMPLLDGTGLVHTPFLALWLALAARDAWKAGTREARRRALVHASFAASALALVGVWLVGFDIPAHNVGARSVGATVERTSEVLAVAVGIAGAPAWPASAAVVLVLSLLGAALPFRAAIREPGERPRARGFLLCFAALACLVASVGWGRANFTTGTGFAGRYAVSVSPLLVLGYLAAVSSRGALARALSAALFLTFAVAFVPNTLAGKSWANQRRVECDNLERDVLAGRSLEQVAARNSLGVAWGDESALRVWLWQLRGARMGPFRFSPLERVERLLELARLYPDRFPMMRAQPAAVRAASHRSSEEVDGEPALVVALPADLRWPVRPGRWVLEGEIAIASSADGAPPLRDLLSAVAIDAGSGAEEPLSVEIAEPRPGDSRKRLRPFAVAIETARPLLVSLRAAEPRGAELALAAVSLSRVTP